VDVRVVAKGPTFEAVVREQVRTLNRVNRRIYAPITRKGIKAIKSGAPTFQGKKLTARTDPPERSATSTTITFYGVSAGAWAIKESGAKEHEIFPRQRPRRGGTRKSALAFPGAGRKTKGGGRTGVAAYVLNHPGVAGRHLWTQAGKRLRAALTPAITDEYDKALT
jgi:hypothetical protein